jgi:hypothetical protein
MAGDDRSGLNPFEISEIVSLGHFLDSPYRRLGHLLFLCRLFWAARFNLTDLRLRSKAQKTKPRFSCRNGVKTQWPVNDSLEKELTAEAPVGEPSIRRSGNRLWFYPFNFYTHDGADDLSGFLWLDI